MRQLVTGALISIFSSVGLATTCPNLAGKFFYSNNSSQSVTIEQSDCVLTMTYENSGNVGKPIQHFGDGVWRVIHDGKYERETQASFAAADVYAVETKSESKSKGADFHLIENYVLRADGNITLKSSIRSGDIFDKATRLLVRD